MEARKKEGQGRDSCKCYLCGQEGHYAAHCKKSSSSQAPETETKREKPKEKAATRADVICYNYHQRGHLARNYPSALYCKEQRTVSWQGGGHREEVVVWGSGAVAREVVGKGDLEGLGNWRGCVKGLDVVGVVHGDLTKGYWQVPVAPADREKTAFTTPFGLFQFRRMPFGLQGAPATFQRMVDYLLDGFNEFAGAYLDDVIVYSSSWKDHLWHLQQALQRIQQAGLTLRRKKCQFAMSDCVYLGHRIGSGRVCPEEAKVCAIRNFQQHCTKKQVRSFLGLTGYYRKFIPQYASLGLPLTDLARKIQPNHVVWSQECEAAFQRLKAVLCASPFSQAPTSKRSL